MLSTEKIAKAFAAIVEEASLAQNPDLPEAVQNHLKTIVSIAKHQSDIRFPVKDGCCGKHTQNCQ